ncbi:hypothetical protein [Corynebacterium lehmanniae]|uniref:Uncharacterized protein n=1 Tax=Corynebacterium lehmanniae TaxID=2913497 RepID=A0ABT4RB60_9CORY|nr:hypothetical protein [Corynebacterium lehmanniae]MCZ9292789.1 hypothetical protein [Corynebacterium lehmanniae]
MIAHPGRSETAGNELKEFLGQAERAAALRAGLVDVDDQDGGALLVG